MFSAAKLVTAGVIVALFGGVLVTSQLTTQDPAEPSVGVSASPSPSPSASLDPMGTAWVTGIVAGVPRGTRTDRVTASDGGDPSPTISSGPTSCDRHERSAAHRDLVHGRHRGQAPRRENDDPIGVHVGGRLPHRERGRQLGGHPMPAIERGAVAAALPPSPTPDPRRQRCVRGAQRLSRVRLRRVGRR